MDSPLFSILIFAGAAYLFYLWYSDYQKATQGTPNPQALPGAASASVKWIVIAVTGAIGLTLVETAGEYQLGVSAEQSDITWFFILPMIAAGIIEEVVFRGYLVIDKKGKAALIASIFGFSFLFALGHYQYYTEEVESGGIFGYALSINAKSTWTLLLLFLNSLWFYAVRFLPANPQRSLLPCFAAHIASNLSVFIIKLAQGHVTGLW